jgi:hypothetical protein
MPVTIVTDSTKYLPNWVSFRRTLRQAQDRLREEKSVKCYDIEFILIIE